MPFAVGYELSRRANKVGTPERPLSELGAKSYLLYWISVLVRFFRKVLELPACKDEPDPSTRSSPDSIRKTKKSTKGWDGERAAIVPGDSDAHRSSSISLFSEPNFGSFRRTHTGPSQYGTRQVTHLSIKCNLGDIARATNLRVDDCAWAMREAGFLARPKHMPRANRSAHSDKKDGDVDGFGDEIFFISREMVDQVAKEWGVKKMMMEVEYVKV